MLAFTYFMIYLLGYAFSIYTFKQINKSLAYYDRVPFGVAFTLSLFSWASVIGILYIGWYNHSKVKQKIDDFIDEFEDGGK